jgi:L-threonylcarbamoyladenylate synthase
MLVTLNEAINLLKSGEVVAIPTETVYGLAASIHQPEAIDKVFSLKKRPQNNPLIVHIANAMDIHQYASELPPDFDLLADAFWPGPLTIVVPIHSDSIPEKARANLPTAAFRVSAHPLANAVIEKTGPLSMPSANLSGSPSSTSPLHVENDFGPSFPILNGGPCDKGLESTILMYTEGWKIIRLGSISPEEFKSVLGYSPEIVQNTDHKAPLCPGQLYRHYAPKAKLTLLSMIPPDLKGVILGHSNRVYPSGCRVISLGNTPAAVAESLYHVLRLIDMEGIAHAYVDLDVPQEGLWLTILERLKKASS